MIKQKNTYITNRSKIEIEITTNCNLSCFNCNRSVRQAPSNEEMSIEQIKKFIEESLVLNWNWEYIGVLGGEPTLNTDFSELMNLFKDYKDKTGCIIEVVTNGSGNKVKEKLVDLPEGIQIRNSNKNSLVNSFFNYNLSPLEIKYPIDRDYSKGCLTTLECGMALTRYGYYPCGAGASIDRVTGLDIGIKKLELINQDLLKEQLRKLCCSCGQFLRDYNHDERITEEKISPHWKTIYTKYAQSKPPLTLY